MADASNDRVLVYDTASITDGENAANVIGEPDFTSGGTGGSTTQSTLHTPVGAAYDAVNDRLFVSDYCNNRVMVFNTATITDGMNAVNEIGHAAGGSAYTTSTGGCAQATMSSSEGIAYDPVNSRLFVADSACNRVAVYNVATGVIANGENASFVLGQTNFTNSGASLTQSRLDLPKSVGYDPNTSRLFVGDTHNQRVLVFNADPSKISTGMNASYVIGEPNFTTEQNVSNSANLTQWGIAMDNDDVTEDCVTYDPATTHLFVCDTYYNRVMIFDGSFLGGNEYYLP